MKYTAKDTETIVDVALNTSGSLTSLPALVAGLPAGPKVGFSQTPWDGHEIRDWGQSWTPNVRGVEIDAPDVVYNERALRKARFDSPREVVDKAADWGQDALVNYNKERVTFTLDYATPFSVTVTIEKGTYYSFPTPDALGFVLPSTHTFVAWTYLGEIVTGMMIDDDTMIEGRIERQPGANMLKGTRTWTNGRYSDDDGSVWGWSANTNGVTINYSADSTINNGDYYVRRIPTAYNSSRRSCVLTYIPTVSKVVPAGSRLVFSFLYKANTNLVSSVLTNYGIADLHYIDGVKDTTFPKDSETHMIELVLTTTADIPANSTLGANGISGFKFYFYQNSGENHDFDFWLPKLEDVTGLPEEEQRATAWVPHVDDPA